MHVQPQLQNPFERPQPSQSSEPKPAVNLQPSSIDSKNQRPPLVPEHIQMHHLEQLQAQQNLTITTENDKSEQGVATGILGIQYHKKMQNQDLMSQCSKAKHQHAQFQHRDPESSKNNSFKWLDWNLEYWAYYIKKRIKYQI